MAEEGFTAEEIDTSRPHPARMYDYYLGGQDNYEVDRIDIGTGIPTSPNTHEVARTVAPDVRVAYVDNDPIVSVYGAGPRRP